MCPRAQSIHPHDDHLAVGFDNGGVTVYDMTQAFVVCGLSGARTLARASCCRVNGVLHLRKLTVAMLTEWVGAGMSHVIISHGDALFVIFSVDTAPVQDSREALLATTTSIPRYVCTSVNARVCLHIRPRTPKLRASCCLRSLVLTEGRVFGCCCCFLSVDGECLLL